MPRAGFGIVTQPVRRVRVESAQVACNGISFVLLGPIRLVPEAGDTRAMSMSVPREMRDREVWREGLASLCPPMRVRLDRIGQDSPIAGTQRAAWIQGGRRVAVPARGH